MIHPKRYYCKTFFLQLLFTHKYLVGLFLKSFFSSLLVAMYSLVCTFLGTFCLKLHLRRIQGIYGYGDNVLSTPLYNQIYNLLCGPALLVAFLQHCFYFILSLYLSLSICSGICKCLPLFGLSFSPSIYLLYHIFLTSLKPKLYTYVKISGYI